MSIKKQVITLLPEFFKKDGLNAFKIAIDFPSGDHGLSLVDAKIDVVLVNNLKKAAFKFSNVEPADALLTVDAINKIIHFPTVNDFDIPKGIYMADVFVTHSNGFPFAYFTLKFPIVGNNQPED